MNFEKEVKRQTSRRQRTFWHSGLLLLLVLSFSLDGETLTLVTDEEETQLLSGHFYTSRNFPSGSKISCKAFKNGIGGKVELKFHGDKVSSGTVQISGSSQGKVECLSISNNTVTSYDFIHLISEGKVPDQALQVKVSTSDETQWRSEGSSVTMNCIVKGAVQENNQSVIVTWLLNGKELENDVSTSIEVKSDFEQSLQISSLSAERHPGTYGCYAEQDSNIGAYDEVLIQVGQPPETVTVTPSSLNVDFGKDFELRCKTSGGQPQPKISWFINDEVPVSENIHLKDNSIFVKRVNMKTAGKFACEASNQFGSKSAFAKVNLSYQAPKIVSNLKESVLMLKGSKLELDCSAEGIPPPQILWMKDNNKIVENPLSFLDLPIEATGTWTCIANNTFGSDHLDVKLKVTERTRILNQSSKVFAHLNSNVSLKCNVEIDPILKEDSEIIWTRGDIILDERGSKLTINKVALQSAGVYECKVTTELDSASHSWQIEVVQSPTILHPEPTHIFALHGSYVELGCNASGIPSPKVSWSNKESDGNGSDVLVIENIFETSEFTCAAWNEHGSSEKTIEIDVVKRTLENMDVFSVHQVDAGESLTLHCLAKVDPKLEPTIQRTWTHNGKNVNSLTTRQHDEKLVLTYIRSQDEGNYECKLSTEVDTILLRHKVIVHYSPPKISDELVPDKLGALEGQNVTLECLSAGIPEPTLTWKSTIGSIESSSSKLTILNVQRSQHEGSYECHAVNEYGSARKNVSLEVYQRAKVDLGESDIVKGSLETVSLKCNVTVDKRLSKITTYSWMKGDKMLIRNSTNTLKLPRINREDEGIYVCLVENRFQTATKVFRLSVLAEKPSFISTEKSVRTLENSNITIACQANGLPLPKIIWYDSNGEQMKATERIHFKVLGDLVMRQVQVEDEGIYRCEASNIYGTISTETELEVIRRTTQDSRKVIVKYVHDEVALPCDLRLDPRIKSESVSRWTKDGNLIIIDAKKFHKEGNSLHIRNLTLDDKGVYECHVTTPFEELTSQITLQVSGEAPKIVSDLKPVMLHEGGTLQLKCLVRGVPKPNIRWLFNDDEMTSPELVHEVVTASEQFRESHVRIDGVTKANEGVYQCEASNIYGSGVAKFSKVSVIRHTIVKILKTEDKLKTLEVRAGEKIKIPCNFDNDPLNRITNITWTKDNESIVIGPSDRIDFGMDGSITITDVQKRHEGTYRCNVATVIDEVSDFITLSVIVNAPVITNLSGDQVIFMGDNILLICTANGIPEPLISWTLNRTDTGVKGKEYLIENAIVTDGGEYACIAKNEYGETKKNTIVRILELPLIDPDYSAKEGSKLKVRCLENTENVKSVWKKDGLDVPNQENGILTIESMSAEDEGLYACFMRSVTGRTKALPTKIRLAPNILVSEGSNMLIEAGSELKLQCKLLPGLNAKRLWKYEGGYVLQGVRNRGAELVIESVEPVNAGTYACLAITNFGHDEIEYNVKVTPVSRDFQSECDPSISVGAPEVETIKNNTVHVTWKVPQMNLSCFEGIKVSWWTNASQSPFHEKELPLSQTEMILENLDSTLNYYIQVNLVAPLNVQVYGETTAFVVGIPSGTMELEYTSDETSPNQTIIITIIAVIGGVLLVFLLTFLIVFLRLRKKKKQTQQQRTPFMDEKSHNGVRYTGVSMYDGSPQVAFVDTNSDFIQSLAPQWPEPEPSEAEETELFLPPPDSTTNTSFAMSMSSPLPPPVPPGNNVRTSISSSWSSLFNVPHDETSVRSSYVSNAPEPSRNSFGHVRKQ